MGVGLVKKEIENDGAKGEVGNCNFFSSNILASVGLESLLNSVYPNWEHLEPVLLEYTLHLFIRFEVEF